MRFADAKEDRLTIENRQGKWDGDCDDVAVVVLEREIDGGGDEGFSEGKNGLSLSSKRTRVNMWLFCKY